MRKALLTCSVILACVTLAVGTAACSGAMTTAAREPVPTRLRVSGSGTALPLLRILAAGWETKEAALLFLPGLHSGGGIKGVADGSLDIGAISRPLTKAETSSRYKVTWLASDALLIAASPDVAALGVRGLTTRQVRDIYSGKITDWSQVGGSKRLPIIVLDRHEDESAKITLRQHVLGTSLKITGEALPLYYESDMVDALRSTPGAIGYFSLGYAVSQNIPVTRLALDGVEATVDNVVDGSYKVVRPLGVITKADAVPQVRDFLTWATSEAARGLMTDKGYAPYQD
jgi:phosphate transport system substrate-binding protein